MARREVCEGCKDSFYANDEEDKYGEDYYCSHCQEGLVHCSLCEKFKLTKDRKKAYIKRYSRRKVKGSTIKDHEYGYICSKCREEYLGFADLQQRMRFKTFRRDSFTCRYCGKSPLKDVSVTLQCDHILSIQSGGETTMSNLVTACTDCNSGKGSSRLNDNEIKIIENREKKSGNCI